MQELAEQTSSGTSRAREGAAARQAGLRRRAEDSPMAAGLVALGAGVLVASLLPPTPAERRAAQRLRSELEPVQERAGQAGRELADGVSQSAQGHLHQVKERAGGAVEQVKQDAMASSVEVKQEAKAAGGQVKGQARASARRVKESNGQAANGSTGRRRPVRAR